LFQAPLTLGPLARAAFIIERKNKSMSARKSRAKERPDGTIIYPESTDSSQMAREAREAVNQRTEEEVEDRAEAAMARII